MPIYESRGPKRGALTRDQKREAEAAIYGLEGDTSLSSPQITPQEIERMRQLVAQHDSQGGIKDFDLNNPPRLPYKYQEYPRIVYHHADRKMRTVNSDEELELALEAGYEKEPYPQEVEAPTLDAATAAEVAAVDRKIAESRKPKKQPKE